MAPMMVMLCILQGAAKKVAPKIFRCFLSNRLEV